MFRKIYNRMGFVSYKEPIKFYSEKLLAVVVA
jgi:hypothetical protein